MVEVEKSILDETQVEADDEKTSEKTNQKRCRKTQDKEPVSLIVVINLIP